MKRSVLIALLAVIILQACSSKKKDNIVPSLKITLLTPENNKTTAEVAELTFTWRADLPNPGAAASYKIKIVEIKGDESPDNALRTNKPIFEKDSLPNPFIKTPLLVFKLGSKYAWQVTGKQDGVTGTSNTLVFAATDHVPVQITLNTPANNSTLAEGAELRFTWEVMIPDAASPVTYKIKVAEVTGDDLPENAIHTNKPIFEKDSLSEIHVVYPATKPALKEGTKYVWRVYATQKGMKDSSALSVFTTAPRTPILITLLTPTNNSILSAMAAPVFSWDATVPNAGSPVNYKITIVEITGDESPDNAIRTNKPIFEKDSGNWFRYDYEHTAPRFKPGSDYAWRVYATQRGIKDSSAAWKFSMPGGGAAGFRKRSQ